MEPFSAHHTGMLCEVCEAASYLFRLENVPIEKRHVKLRSFTEARRNLDCPLCAFGVGYVEAEKKLPSKPDSTFFWVQWQLLLAPLFRILFSCPSPKGHRALPGTVIYCHFNIIDAFNPLVRGQLSAGIKSGALSTSARSKDGCTNARIHTIIPRTQEHYPPWELWLEMGGLSWSMLLLWKSTPFTQMTCLPIRLYPTYGRRSNIRIQTSSSL